MVNPSIDSARLTARAEGWTLGAITAGFVATIGMTVVLLGAYLVVRALGNADAGVPQLWFWSLSHNRVVDFTTGSPYLLSALHLAFGIAWALAYAGMAEPRLAGPGWRRGMIFSLVLWLGSVVVFLPIVGGGVFGSALSAGPLPVIGNLVLHLVYGALLGDLYARARRSSVDIADLSEEMAEQVASMLRAEPGVAVGLGGGALVGFGIGVFVARTLRLELVPAMDLAMPLVGGRSCAGCPDRLADRDLCGQRGNR